MTLSTQTRARLTAILGDYRTTWQTAGINAAILETSQQHPNDDLLVIALAISAARDPKALTPAVMHNRAVDVTVLVPAHARPAPRNDDPTCTECGSQTRRPDGTCNGCWQNRQTAPPERRPAPPVFRPAAPPPADFRERVAAIAARSSLASNVPTRNQKEQQQ